MLERLVCLSESAPVVASQVWTLLWLRRLLGTCFRMPRSAFLACARSVQMRLRNASTS